MSNGCFFNSSSASVPDETCANSHSGPNACLNSSIDQGVASTIKMRLADICLSKLESRPASRALSILITADSAIALGAFSAFLWMREKNAENRLSNASQEGAVL